MNYSETGTVELRKLVRERGLANGMLVAGARKDDLIALLEGRITALPGLGQSAEQPEQSNNSGASDGLADVLANALRGKINAGVDAEQVKSLVREYTESDEFSERVKLVTPAPRWVHVTLPDQTEVELKEHTHRMFSDVLAKVAAGLPVLMVGPAGTGKTHLAGQVAKALKRRFSFNSMSAGCSESHIIGRTLPDSTGNWVYKPSPFVAAYREGGVHLFDEIDAADPNLMVLINAPIANGHLSIPFEDMVVERHPDTVIIAAANTYGTGASRQYVGRNALDAATLNRFAMSTVEVDYDTDLEKAVLSDMMGKQRADDWHGICLSVRNGIMESGLRRIMSTRNMIDGAKLVLAGASMTTVIDGYLTGWSKDELRKIGR